MDIRPDLRDINLQVAMLAAEKTFGKDMVKQTIIHRMKI